MNVAEDISIDTLDAATGQVPNYSELVGQSSYDLSFWSIFWLVILAATLYISFYVIYEFVIKLIQNRKARSSAKRYFPIITSFIWLVYFTRVGYIFIKPYPLVGIGVVLILLLGFWRFIKDFIAGIVFRVQDNYRTNQRVQLKNNEGVIVELLNTHVKLEADDGELIFVPYSEFANQIVYKPSTQERLKQFSFRLVVDTDTDVDIDKINRIALSCPWIVSNRIPRIAHNEDDEELIISGYTLDLKYLPKIKNYFE
jgi:hypothetical protein